MVDETSSSTAASPTPVAAPAASEAVSSPPAAASAAPVAAPAVAEPTLPSTVLGAAPEIVKAPEAAPAADAKTPAATDTQNPSADASQAADAPKADASQSAESAPLPSYEPFTLPEGITPDTERLGEFTNLLASLETNTKADHAVMQKFGQELVDRHVAEVQNTVTRLTEAYQQAWVKQTEDWKQQFISDPEIGGNRQATTVASANEFISTHGGTPEHQAQFRKLMQDTGIGNHPAMIRILANAMNSPNYREGRPLAAATPPVKASRTQRMYGKKNG